MIDLVEQANPADLENAGEALKNARNVMAAAAKELGEYIDRVDWEGVSGEAFRKWGKNLVKDTHLLADFADTASVQIASAGAGLASVRSSMPPRDQRADPKMVEDIPTPKRVDGNAEYDAAAKAEGHRQEAINQMNRLSSFYQVSHQSMAGQEPPTFSAMPEMGVPRPSQAEVPRPPGDGQEARASAAAPGSGQASPPVHASSIAMAGDTGSGGGLPTSSNGAPGSVTSPDRPVSTEIDSVDTLPPQTVAPASGHQPPAPGPTPNDVSPAPPLSPGRVNPVIGGPTARTSGPVGGTKNTMPVQQGRTSTGGPGQSGGPGRGPAGPIGRAGPTAEGRAGSGRTAPGHPSVGRSVTGGTPRSLGAPDSRPGGPGATGAARTPGVVGGRPMPGPVSGASGSRVPRGPVVGGGFDGARPTSSGFGQRGVVGSTPQGAGSRGPMPGRGIRNPDGVVGAPKGRASAAGGHRNGFTTGGAGLVRGPMGSRQRPDQEEDEDTQRPDYLAEDEETHLPRTQRAVPPVID